MKTQRFTSIQKRILFEGLFLLGLFAVGCTSGNCRSQQETPEALAKAPKISMEELTQMKETSKGQRVLVYKADGSLQCNQGQKISLDEMAKELSGIKIYSKLNKSDGKMRIQLCGSPTGNCNLYEIDRENLDQALKIGFKEWPGST
jgi:hypothetical protein